MSFSIGADVELFAKNKVGHHVALCGLIGGDKANPKPVMGGGGFAVQEDNVSLEWNIPPAKNIGDFSIYVDAIMTHSRLLVENLGFVLSTESSAIFDKEQLLHPTAQVFGCEPDYNAWKMCENKKPQAKNKQLRTAGGHIHVGTHANTVDSIKQLDLFLGVPSVFLDNSESSKARRELYGKAGAMRPKPYGFEYRVLSNFWAFNSDYQDWVFKMTYRAIMAPSIINAKVGKEIVRVINQGDEDGARTLAKDFGLPLPPGVSLI